MTKSFQNTKEKSLDVNVIFDQLDKTNSTPQKDIRQQINKAFIKGLFCRVTQSVINDDIVGTVVRLRGHRSLILGYIYYQLRQRKVVYMTQETLAEICGVTRRTVNRAIAQFKELGLLDVGTRYKESCIYQMPEYIKASSQLSTVYALLCPEWSKFKINTQSVSLNILGSILINEAQDFKCPIDFSGGNQGYYVVPRLPTLVKKERERFQRKEKTINGKEKVMKQTNVNRPSHTQQEIRPIIAAVKNYLPDLLEGDLEQLAAYEDLVLEFALYKTRLKKPDRAIPFFKKMCQVGKSERSSNPYFKGKQGSKVTGSVKDTASKNPIYKPYELKERVQENPLDAAANIEKNRQRIVDNLSKFMSKEQANEIVSRRVTYYLDINEGKQASPVNSVQQLFHVDEEISGESMERLEKFVVELDAKLKGDSNDSKEIYNHGRPGTTGTSSSFTQQQKTMGPPEADKNDPWNQLSVTA